jgi:hypothetical protein
VEEYATDAVAKADLDYDRSPASGPNFRRRSRSTSKKPCLTSSSSRPPDVYRNPRSRLYSWETRPVEKDLAIAELEEVVELLDRRSSSSVKPLKM